MLLLEKLLWYSVRTNVRTNTDAYITGSRFLLLHMMVIRTSIPFEMVY